jgi:hypothetical protein
MNILKSMLKKVFPGGGTIPSMITFDESKFYATCAGRYRGSEGAIVDLGCWMGATTVALAKGLLRGPHGAPVHSEKVLGYDIFLWRDWMPDSLPFCVYREGESFLPEARRYVRDEGGGLIELIQTDLSVYDWKTGSIKILLVDAMKSLDLARQIAVTFYPSLRVGATLIHQDFKHFYTSWIHVLQYRLRDHFRMVHSVPASPTVAFELLTAIMPAEVIRATDFDHISDDESEACFRHSMGMLEESERINVAAAHVWHYYHLNRIDKVHETLTRYIALGMGQKGEFPFAIHHLPAQAKLGIPTVRGKIVARWCDRPPFRCLGRSGS